MHRQSLLQKIRVIGCLQPHEKLATQTERLSTYSPSLQSTLQRLYQRETRDHNLYTVEQVINSMLDEVEQALSEAAVHGAKGDAAAALSVQERLQVTANESFVREACAVLETAKTGLANLQQTYASDAAIQTRIVTLVALLEARLLSIETIAADVLQKK